MIIVFGVRRDASLDTRESPRRIPAATLCKSVKSVDEKGSVSLGVSVHNRLHFI